jgi:hypothetical protein
MGYLRVFLQFAEILGAFIAFLVSGGYIIHCVTIQKLVEE